MDDDKPNDSVLLAFDVRKLDNGVYVLTKHGKGWRPEYQRGFMTLAETENSAFDIVRAELEKLRTA